MPSTLQKTRKQIAKKRNGDVNSLHEKSRNSMRLNQAAIRDQRLVKLAATRNKKEKPIVNRVKYFQQGVRDKGGDALDVVAIQELVHTFVHQYDEEFDELKKARRPGRPPSAKEDLLKMKIDALEEEYKGGFLLPDITSADSVKLLEQWERSWAYLTTLAWIKVTPAGNVRKSELPSKALH